ASASSLLNPAKVDGPAAKISQSLAKLSPERSAENVGSSRFSRFSRSGGKEDIAPSGSSLVELWKSGVDALLSMPRPKTYPANEWTTLLDDAVRFVKHWADQADRLGWKSWEIWGVSRSAPRYRFDGMGLVVMLHGQKIAALTAEAAVVETRTSNLLRFYRRPSDPLAGSERILIWELI
ncbi:MAG: hypothetical protein HC869_16110, partial [Rhodospirillales bacterium]|nr:hypothetical protein [Rhodospirillales bacterium]